MSKFLIQYEGKCTTGLVRNNNEDNYWCEGACLPEIHGDQDRIAGSFFTGPQTWFSVFDGMGGEQCGETASFLAASTFGKEILAASAPDYRDPDPQKEYDIDGKPCILNIRPDPQQICLDMNTAVIDYAEKHHIRRIGTTAAALCFSGCDLVGFNVGDSRCYRYRDQTLVQLSTDHVKYSYVMGRSYLSQCIGMPRQEYLPEPAVFHSFYQPGDLYVLCSDGLCYTIDDAAIQKILSGPESLREKLEDLFHAVYEAGAPDNITIFLFEVTTKDS